MTKKPRILVSFEEGGENGGPYNSHKRIVNGLLKSEFDFVPLIVPRNCSKVQKIRSLVEQIRKYDPDIVHAHGLQLTGFYLAVAARICNKPCVMAVRGSSMEAIEFQWYKKACMYCLEAISLLLSNMVYCNSHYVASWRQINLYAGNKNAGVFYNVPHDCSLTERCEQQIGGVVRVISTGRIIAEKGYDILADVIIRMPDYKNVEYLIVGDGDYLPTFKTKIDNSTKRSYVKFLGFQNDVTKYYATSDIFITCTKHETLCNSLIEAGAEGLPLIASDVGGVPEIIENGVNGYLVKGDHVDDYIYWLETLINNSELREAMGRRAKELIAEKFDNMKTMTQIRNVYRSIIIKHAKTY